MTDVLASKSDTFHGGVEKSKRRVAVFDSGFKMIHETPRTDDPSLTASSITTTESELTQTTDFAVGAP
jgi:hypothetical protein